MVEETEFNGLNESEVCCCCAMENMTLGRFSLFVGAFFLREGVFVSRSDGRASFANACGLVVTLAYPFCHAGGLGFHF